MPVALSTILLLIASNIFMTFAWYGHLKFKHLSLLTVIGLSWLIALPEYILQVPANRMGHSVFSAAQLKMLQEVITLVVFCVFAVTFLKEELRWNHFVAFGFLLIGAAFMFYDKA